MLTLSATLEAHQQGAQRRPSVAAAITNNRNGFRILSWQRQVDAAGEADAPHGIAICGAFVLRVRNDAGTLKVSRLAYPLTGTAAAGWTNVAGAIAAGNPVAIAAADDGSEAIILAGHGTALKVWQSTDSGQTWSGPTTIVTEGAAIGAVALAFKTQNTNCCAFYTIGTTTTLNRLRRTAGTWAASGTNWSRSASVASLTGVAAAYNGSDFVVSMTGTEVTTLHPRWWVALMGDVNLPINTWSGLRAIAEADAASGTSYKAPAVASLGDAVHGYAVQVEAGNVAFSRAVYSHSAQTGATAQWTEPFPSLLDTTTYGLAIARSTAASQVCAGRADGLWTADAVALDLSASLTASSWRLTPDSLRVRADFDDHDGSLLTAEISPGYSLVLTHGYASAADGSTETGYVLTATIDQVRHTLADGQRGLRLEAHGAWEEFAAWRATQAWQTAAGVLTRAAIFDRLASRAGVALTTGTGGRAPSAQWTADTPAFAVAAGETGESLLRRLLAVTSDFARPAATLEIVGFAATDTADYAYGAAHAISTLETMTKPLARSWSRVIGPDRYADALDYASDQLHRVGARLQLERNLDATTDAHATTDAASVLRRPLVLAEAGELVAAANVGAELFDVVSVTYANLSQAATLYRVTGLGIEYKRGPKGARYDSIITLGGL